MQEDSGHAMIFRRLVVIKLEIERICSQAIERKRTVFVPVTNTQDNTLHASSSDRSGNTKSAKRDMSYPQFVEALALLARSAAGRLRLLYPDVAGMEPRAVSQGTPKADEISFREVAGSGVHHSVHCSGPSVVEMRPVMGAVVGEEEHSKHSTNAETPAHIKARGPRAALRSSGSRYLKQTWRSMQYKRSSQRWISL